MVADELNGAILECRSADVLQVCAADGDARARGRAEVSPIAIIPAKDPLDVYAIGKVVRILPRNGDCLS